MTIAYDILFRVTVHHTFYMKGLSADFSFQPTPHTQRLLDTYGLVFKKSDQGFTVFARVEPASDPPKLFIPIHQNSLRFSFLMVPKNNHFYNFTKFNNNKFPQPGKEVVYYSNAKMVAADAPVLGDKISATSGTYLQLLNRNVYNLKYNSPLNASHPALSDMFGKVYTPMPAIDLPAGKTTDELQIDFKKIKEIKPGRYRISDANLPADVHLYYEPEWSGQEVFGIVDIFSDTNAFTQPTDDLVAPEYKFLNGDELTRQVNKLPVADYRIALEASAYEWRYTIQIKPETQLGTINPGDMEIPDFNGGAVGPDQAVFTSNVVISWSEALTGFPLKRISGPGNLIKSLPSPTVFHPLKKRTIAPNNEVLFYDLNIYV